jgi:serine/threonine-protein kinase
MSRDADDNGSIGSQSAGASSGGGVKVDSGTRSIPAPRWLGKRVGRFKLVALLGQGAMGRVFRAEDTVMGRHVALKVLPKSLKKGAIKLRPEVLINEARAAAAIEHPNAVQIYEVNQAGDVCYVAMELLEGGSLRELVRAAGPMDLARACVLCAEAAEALAAAHAAGVVHRDVKPANLMLSRQGRCKVVDFGLARLENSGDWGLMAESVGTPQFIAPELLSGTPASAQSDIYSLGGTLWYLLTGSAPYQGKDAQELLRMHMESPVPDLRSVRPEAPGALAEALKTALAKRPAERFATMEQFARVLRMNAIPMPAGAEPAQRPAAPANGRSRRPATPPDPASRVAGQPQPPSNKWSLGYPGISPMVVGAGVVVVVAMVVVICLILSHHGAPAVSQNPPPVATPSGSPPLVTTPGTVTTPPNTVAAPAPQPDVQSTALPTQILSLGDFEQQSDIGILGHHGYVDFDPALHRYSVTSAGKDIFGHADAFHFVWRKISGDVTIRAKIVILGDKKDTSQKGVLMVRQNLDPGSVFMDAAVHSNGQIALQFRAQPDGPSDRRLPAVSGSIVWLERKKNEFTLYVSDGNGPPTPAAHMNLPMEDPVEVGLGVASHDQNKQVTAVFSDLMIKQGTINK